MAEQNFVEAPPSPAPVTRSPRPAIGCAIATILLCAGVWLTAWLANNTPGTEARQRRATIERLEHEQQRYCEDGERAVVVEYAGWYKLTCARG